MKKLIHPITKEEAIRDEYTNSRAVSDWNWWYYTYSEETILAYWFKENEKMNTKIYR